MCYHLVSFILKSSSENDLCDAVVCKADGGSLNVFELIVALKKHFNAIDVDIFNAESLEESRVSEFPQDNIVYI